MFLLFTICQLLVIPFKGAFQVKTLKCEKIHMLVSAETHVWFHQVRYNLDDVYSSDTQEGTRGVLLLLKAEVREVRFKAPW